MDELLGDGEGLGGVASVLEVRGPEWCAPGLDRRGGRYPLSVESPVLAMVDTLVPGVSTLTSQVRYYSLYWALAQYSEEQGFDAASCRVVLRRAEVAVAEAAIAGGVSTLAHGTERVMSLRNRGVAGDMAAAGSDSYSPRAWGFWDQYNGPNVVMGTVSVDGGALRSGRHRCPSPVGQLFEPMLELVADRPATSADIAEFASMRWTEDDTPDLEPLAELFTATRGGRHVPDDWSGNDLTRRSTLRILARAGQVNPAAAGWLSALRQAVAYGDLIDTDPVLSTEERAQAWRGVLLRHHSVGAWRRLWARLVNQVVDARGSFTRDDLHEWVTSAVSPGTVWEFVASLPDAADRAGNPLPAEEIVRAGGDDTRSDVALLLLGALRLDQLDGRARDAFLGKARRRRQFLDPHWVTFRRDDHADRPLAELARAFVDDMLAQSRRVALRKLRVESNGRMTVFTKLHERNGRYFADQREGAGNVGLRIVQLGGMAEQLGLASSASGIRVGRRAAELLALPA